MNTLIVKSYLKRVLRFFVQVRISFILIFALFLVLLVVQKLYSLKSKSILGGNSRQSSLTRGENGSGGFLGERSSGLRILCYVMVEEGKLRAAKIIGETWGAHCDKLIFYGGGGQEGNSKTKMGLNLVALEGDGIEGYDHLWGKTKAALLHLNQHSIHEADWFLKADIDTFVLIGNLRRFIAKRDLNLGAGREALWFGFKMKHRKMPHGYMSGGAGYVMNTQALQRFSQLVQSNRARDYVRLDPFEGSLKGCKTVENRGIEDLELGRCFHALGVRDVGTVDEFGRHRFLPLSLLSLMSGDVQPGHWIWEQAWTKLTSGKLCCSDELISMHEVSPSQQRFLYFLTYRLNISSGYSTQQH